MTRSDLLTVALPKGKLYEDTVQLLGEAGLPVGDLLDDSRKLVFLFPEQQVRYIICRPTDIPTYVESGAADIGVAGKDTIVEQGKDVVECADLKFGYCRFVVALPDEIAQTTELQWLNHARVATKFPSVADAFFQEKGMQMEIIKLHGNIELAPAVGLAEMIVDIVSSGRTLKENKLTAVADIFHATARLIVNRVSYRLNHRRIHPLVEKVRELVRDQEVRS